VAAKGEVFVQFWLKPGEQAVFEVGDEPLENIASKQIQPFFDLTVLGVTQLKP